MGNVPLGTSKKEVLHLFRDAFGRVSSVRLRSAPVVGTAVDRHGDANLVKRVCAHKDMFSDAKDSLNAYGESSRPRTASTPTVSQVGQGRPQRLRLVK